MGRSNIRGYGGIPSVTVVHNALHHSNTLECVEQWKAGVVGCLGSNVSCTPIIQYSITPTFRIA